MNHFQNALLFILLLALLIFVHELGHFLVAKLFRVKVVRFSLGFGPRLLGFTWGETEYQVAAIPLGGYVKMAGDDPTEEVSPEDRGRGFLEQSPGKRAAIAFAGPAMSLLFPVLAYFVAFALPSQEVSTRIGQVIPGHPAWMAGLHAGDRIVSVDGQPVRDFSQLKESVAPHWERPLTLEFERDGQLRRLEVVPRRDDQGGPFGTEPQGLIGVSPYAASTLVGVREAGSPAARAGLATFDLVRKVGDTEVKSWSELEAELARARGPVALTIARPTSPGKQAGAPASWPTRVISVDPELRDGKPSYGIESADLYVYSVESGTPAWEAGVRRGDRLLELNGTPLQAWAQFDELRKSSGQQLRLAFLHDGARLEREVLQREETVSDELGRTMKRRVLGMAQTPAELALTEPETITVSRPLSEAFARAVRVVPEGVRTFVVFFGMLLTGQVGSKSFGSVIMMYDVTAQAAQAGWDKYLQVMGWISINLGVLNLLPIPILDGFHILSSGIETVRRRPLSLKARLIANYTGLVLLLGLMLLALKNDIMRYVFN